MKIEEAITSAAEELRAAGISEPVREANSLLQFTLVRDRSFLIAHPEYELSGDELARFQAAVTRRASREPYQHIVGRQEFFGLDFIVSPDVLIPRPETEIIVEKAIALLETLPAPRFLEIGVGSGCISIAILKHVAKAAAVGVDISESAISVACRNAVMHGVADRLAIHVSDVFDKVPDERFDLIASNPPYVPLDEYLQLQPEVRDHDPRIAVTDGSTGLRVIRRIVEGSPAFLRPGGDLVMEIGYGQSEAVKAMFHGNVWDSVEVISDLQGIPRTVVARRS